MTYAQDSLRSFLCARLFATKKGWGAERLEANRDEFEAESFWQERKGFLPSYRSSIFLKSPAHDSHFSGLHTL